MLDMYVGSFPLYGMLYFCIKSYNHAPHSHTHTHIYTLFALRAAAVADRVALVSSGAACDTLRVFRPRTAVVSASVAATLVSSGAASECE